MIILNNKNIGIEFHGNIECFGLGIVAFKNSDIAPFKLSIDIQFLFWQLLISVVSNNNTIYFDDKPTESIECLLDNIEHSVRMPYVFKKCEYQEWQSDIIYYTLSIVIYDEIIYIFKGDESISDCPDKLLNEWDYFDLDAQLQTAINTENYELANKIKGLLV